MFDASYSLHILVYVLLFLVGHYNSFPSLVLFLNSSFADLAFICRSSPNILVPESPSHTLLHKLKRFFLFYLTELKESRNGQEKVQGEASAKEEDGQA